jgi:hypothetical protein
MDPPANWNQLKNRCANSACNTANGGCTIALSDNFVMGSYTSEIDFSGKTLNIWGQGKVLDASGGGRVFIGQSAGSFLELHDAVLQNGYAAMLVCNGGTNAGQMCFSEQNCPGSYCSAAVSRMPVSGTFLNFLYVRAGHMGQFRMTAADFARIIPNFDAGSKSGRWFSFALLFGSIRAISAKLDLIKLSFEFLAGHMEHLNAPPLYQCRSERYQI